MSVLERMTAKNPRDRYQTPAEVALALEPFALTTAVDHKGEHRAGASKATHSRTLLIKKSPAFYRHEHRIVALAAALLFVVAGLLGVGVYRIATDNGELVIETDNDDVEVVVSNRGKVVKIIDTKSGKHVTLNSGEYELALKDGQDGLKLSPDTMTLKRGETKLATITREGKGPAAAKRPPDGVVAWWRADGNAKDSAGDNHGTLKGGVTFAPGVAGQAFRLDGATRYVEVPRSDLWGFGERDFSIELWVQFQAVRPSERMRPSAAFIGSDEGGGNHNKWFFAHGGGFIYFHINRHATRADDGFYLAEAPFSPALHQWYHLAVTRSRGEFTIYVNGARVGSQYNAVVMPNPDAPLTIGWAEGEAFVNGLIDEVAIYDRALSPEEVKARWSALAPATKKDRP